MTRDRVVWAGCVLIFVAGVIWGSATTGFNFLKVTSIHDLFEILSSMGTVLAVLLAFDGLQDWRSQITGKADHELARRLAIASQRFKESCFIAWTDTELCWISKESRYGDWAPGMMELIISSNEAHSVAAREHRASLLAVLVEVRALWGEDKAKEYDALLEFYKNCELVIELFTRLNSKITVGEYDRVGIKGMLDCAEEGFKKEGCVTGAWQEVKEAIELRALAANATLNEKLMRNVK